MRPAVAIKFWRCNKIIAPFSGRRLNPDAECFFILQFLKSRNTARCAGDYEFNIALFVLACKDVNDIYLNIRILSCFLMSAFVARDAGAGCIIVSCLGKGRVHFD